MGSRRWIWPGLCIFFLVVEIGAAAGIRLEFVRQATGDEREVEDYLRESHALNDIVGRLTRRFRFPSEVTIRIGTTDGPLYDVGTRTIRMPFDLDFLPSPLDERLDMVERRSLYAGAFAFAVGHEIGHALVHLYHWPVRNSAEEEELADGLAVHFVLNVLDCREAVARSLAEAARLENSEDGGARDEEPESTACLQPARLERVFCWLAGADPERLNWLWKLGLNADESPEICRARYRELEVRLRPLLRQAERSSSDSRQ